VGGRIVDREVFKLKCPKCSYDFDYDRGYLNKNIDALGQEIKKIQVELVHWNSLSYEERYARREWRARAVKALEVKKNQIGHLKTIRNTVTERRDVEFHALMKDAIKDIYGEEGFKRVVAWVHEAMTYNHGSLAVNKNENPDNKLI
jgi:hypothetical protein